MKKIFTTYIFLCSLVVSAFAVTVNDVAGTFKGNLNIGGDNYPNKEIYILPGIKANTITFVLPDFKYGAASLGNIVLVNMPMNSNGRLTMEDATLYIRAISERATISVINGMKDGGVTYNSEVSATAAQVLLSIAAPSLPEPIFVLFSGSKVTNENYAITNGGFEGSWSNSEPNGWHSFPTATGSMSSFVTGNTDQFQQTNETRPGSTGTHSAMLQSNLVLGAKANGNCTNGQINAGSTTADDASGNYNFSDPGNSGYNTPFVGTPDSLVFWSKYIPADKNPSNSVNKARAHAVITTNARYQDPETSDYSSVKIGEASINYAANSDMSWQRFAVPFTYTSVDPSKAAYMLITFTSNMTPGGGSTYSEGGIFNKKYYYDNVYLDDAEMIYNHALTSFTMDGKAVSFTNGAATTSQVFSDSDYNFAVSTNGKAAKSFIGYDTENNQVAVYVVADNFSQARAYSLYTLQMAEPIRDTYYEYSASTCDNEPYSDELFTSLTEAGTYTTTIPNAGGHDSIITLTLSVLPTYAIPTTATINMDESYTWRGHTYENLAPGDYTFTDELKTKAGCDSIYTLTLTVKPISYFIEEEMTACLNEEATWHGKTLPTDQAGTVTVFDSLKSIYDTDSVYRLTLIVHPTYIFSEEEVMYMDEAYTWRGHTYENLGIGEHTFTDELKTKAGCDSVYTLTLTVKPISYSFKEEMTACQNEEIRWHGKALPTDHAGTVTVFDSLKSVYGADSIYQVHLTINPSYIISEEATIIMDETYTWRGHTYENLVPDEYTYTEELKTQAGCDSIYTLTLTVKPIGYYAFDENMTVCPHEEATWHGKTLPTDETGTVIIFDSLKSIYGVDSIYRLHLTVLPSYLISEEATIAMDEAYAWRGHTYENLVPGVYSDTDELKTKAGCDSIYTLTLTVRPISYSFEEGLTVCPLEEATWHGKTLPTDETGTVVIFDSLKSVYNTDSVYRLTLTVLPTYGFTDEAAIFMDESYSWHGHTYENLLPGEYTDTDELKTQAGCDSIYTLTLTVKPISYSFEEELTACQGEEAIWHGKTLPTDDAGVVIVFDSLKSVYDTDSVFHLTLTVLPTYIFTDEATIFMDESYSWRGQTYENLEPGEYTYTDELKTQAGCDSVYTLTLTVKALEYYSFNEEMTTCQGEEAIWHGKTLPTDEAGTVIVFDSLLSVHNTDSVYRLTLTVAPTYTIDEYLTITVGEEKQWEVWDLSTMPEGKSTLYASYYTVNDCDSTLVLHLTVEPLSHEALPDAPESDERCARKVLINGRLYIIRKDETIYDILGKKIK